MSELRLFTDGSVNPQSNIGYGSYLVVPDNNLSLDSLKKQIKVKCFEQTSSTKLELQTLLWALNDIAVLGRRVEVYTDSQNIIALPARRQRFEENNYRSKKNRLLNNYELYQAFYKVTDQLHCIFIKVEGHKKSNQKTDVDKLFTLVDRASRKALTRIFHPKL